MRVKTSRVSFSSFSPSVDYGNEKQWNLFAYSSTRQVDRTSTSGFLSISGVNDEEKATKNIPPFLGRWQYHKWFGETRSPPSPSERKLERKKKETDFTRHFHTLDFTFHHAMLSVLSVTRADCRTRFESSKHSIEEEEEKKNCRYRFSQTRKAAQSWNREHTNSRQTVRVREKREKYTSCPCLKPNNIKDNDHPA